MTVTQEPEIEQAESGGVVYEALTEEECYLFAILQDASGLDLAEFAFVDDTQEEDACFRAYPMQWPWWRNMHPRQVEQGGRDTGKSMSIQARAAIHPLINPGAEMAITGPEKAHLKRVTTRIEQRYLSIRLLEELLIGGRSQINAWPFLIRFKNGAQIVGAIPQKSGLGFKGLHSVWLETDEAQDLTDEAWSEIRETLRQHLPNAQWRVHGVSKGIPDEFRRITTKPELGWKVHRITQYHKPTFTAEERERKIKDYGGTKDAPEFRRQVLGAHGDSTNLVFDLAKLMQNCDSNEGSDYNVYEYYRKTIRFDQVQEIARGRGIPPENYHLVIKEMLDLPLMHKEKYKVFWAGMDCGIVQDPSAIMVFAEYEVPAEERRRDAAAGIAVPAPGVTRLKLLARIELLRIPVPDQAQALMHVIDFYRPRTLALDKTGNGTGILQVLQQEARVSRLMNVQPDADDDQFPDQERAEKALVTIKGYDFNGKIVVEIDEAAAAELPPGMTNKEIAEAVGIKKQVKTHATDCMRLLVDTNRYLLPFDDNLIRQLTGQTWVYMQSQTDKHPPRRYSEGQFHCLVTDTLVRTSVGEVPIQDVVPGMMVATRAGWRPVLDAWQTGSAAEVVTVDCSNGASLTGTPEHRVWTGRGWVELQHLDDGDEVTCWSNELRPEAFCPSGSFSMESSSTAIPNPSGTPTASTSRARRGTGGSTRRSGSIITARSRRATTSTTATRTRSTTMWRTSSVSHPKSTLDDTGNSTTTSTFARRRICATWRKSVRRLLRGIAVPRAGHGIASTAGGSQRRPSSGPLCASTAGGLSTPRSLAAFAPIPAPASRRRTSRTQPSRLPVCAPRAAGSSSATGMQGGSTARIVGQPRSEAARRAVYDLTVADQPEFFANGILVHNSFDGCRMAALGMFMQPMELILNAPPPAQKPVLDIFGGDDY